MVQIIHKVVSAVKDTIVPNGIKRVSISTLQWHDTYLLAKQCGIPVEDEHQLRANYAITRNHNLVTISEPGNNILHIIARE